MMVIGYTVGFVRRGNLEQAASGALGAPASSWHKKRALFHKLCEARPIATVHS